jgi:hypothetical protein
MQRNLLLAKVRGVSTIVLAEATWVLAAVYDLTHSEIATAVDMLDLTRNVL